ncbi:hypothetical protein [Actinoplanes sp. NPDC026623]|uniref:hypothetical protein n=1 Tax=Actinoplanes sp. NPDC026623 TaxID=3155610 RepID=UPI0033CC87AA
MGTVSGLALLAGGTAVAAVTGGNTVFSSALLGMLAAGLSHALLTEIRRQARRRSPGGWAVQDTVNAVLLACLAVGALIATVLVMTPSTARAVGLTLTIGYAASSAYFVRERRRAITAPAAEAR